MIAIIRRINPRRNADDARHRTSRSRRHRRDPRPHRRNQPLPVLRLHAAYRPGVARLPGRPRPDAGGTAARRRVGVVQLRRCVPGLPRRPDLHLGGLRQDHRVGDGPHHPRDGRQGAPRSPQPGGQSVPGHRAGTLGAGGHRAGVRSVDRRIQGRRPGGPGDGADVRISHPDHLDPARSAAGGPGPVPAAVPRPHLDPDRHHGGADRGGRTARLFPRAGRTAAPQTHRRHHRRPGHRRDRRRKAQRRRHHRVPAAAVARRTRDNLSLVGQPAVFAAHPSRTAGNGVRETGR